MVRKRSWVIPNLNTGREVIGRYFVGVYFVDLVAFTRWIIALKIQREGQSFVGDHQSFRKLTIQAGLVCTRAILI